LARLLDLTCCGIRRLVNMDMILHVGPVNPGDESVGSDIQFAGATEILVVDQSCSTIKEMINGE